MRNALKRVTKAGHKNIRLEARFGRGSKRAAWVDAFNMNLRDVFDRIRRLGVKFNLSTLHLLAFDILRCSNSPEYSMNQTYPLYASKLHNVISRGV